MGSGSFAWIVTDSTTGSGISGAFVNLFVGTNPCPTNWLGQHPGCTSGPGYPIQTYTDATGKATAQAKYNCPSDLSGTVSAAGYASRDFSDSTGVQSGTTNYTVALTPSTVSSTVGAVPGQGTSALTTPLTDQIGSSLNSAWLAGTQFTTDLGWIAAVAVIGIAIALVAILVLSRGLV
jgi:hypothetical protein